MKPLFRYVKKRTELVEDVLFVRDGGKEPIEVVLIHPLWEESDNSQKIAGTGAELAEGGRSEREFDRGSQALIVLCPKYLRASRLQLLGHTIIAPHVVRCRGCQKSYQKGVIVEELNQVTDDFGPPAVVVDVVEDVACRLPRQLVDHWALAEWGGHRDARSDADADRSDLTQFVHHLVYLLCIRPLRIEDGLDVVQDDKYLLGGKGGSQQC